MAKGWQNLTAAKEIFKFSLFGKNTSNGIDLLPHKDKTN
jgi:hypothetical protein